MPVWSYMSFWQKRSDKLREHYVAKSDADPSLLSYIQTTAKGQRGIRSPIKPGKYLTKYFSDVLTAKEIAGLATWQATGSRETVFNDPKAYVLGFAKTPDEIEHVYLHGPESCMSKPTVCYRPNIHPTRIYGAGDLAVAYLTEVATGKIRARALVWPEQKHCGRVYPTKHCFDIDGFVDSADSEAMAAALTLRIRTEGYQFESECPRGFDGARLLIETWQGRYVMPYLDNDYGYSEDSDGLTMLKHGGNASDTNGLSTEDVEDVEDDDDSESWESCENCEDAVPAEDARTVVIDTRRGRAHRTATWCENCGECHAFYCRGLHEYVRDSMGSIEINGQLYSRGYAEHQGYWTSSHRDESYWNDEPQVTLEDGQVWTQDEFSEYGFTCAITGANYCNTEAHYDHPDIWEGCSGRDIAEHLMGLTGPLHNADQMTLELAA